MSVPKILMAITSALDRAGIAYMLTGSFASAYYGFPRSTQDIDLVILATLAQLRDFIASLPAAEYYADLEAAIEANRRQSMFNVIDQVSGWKIDLIMRKSRPFSQEEFGRRRQVSLQGILLSVASAEDVLIAKLEWAKLSQSRRQIEDAAGILKSMHNSLDRPYLKKWIQELQLETEWTDALRIAGVFESE